MQSFNQRMGGSAKYLQGFHFFDVHNRSKPIRLKGSSLFVEELYDWTPASLIEQKRKPMSNFDTLHSRDFPKFYGNCFRSIKDSNWSIDITLVHLSSPAFVCNIWKLQRYVDGSMSF